MAQEPEEPPRRSQNPIGDIGSRRAERARRIGGGWGPAYQGAMEATLAVAISVGIGLWVDAKLDTSPIGMLVGLGVGFGAFVLRLVRLVHDLTPRDGGEGGGPEGRETGTGGSDAGSGARDADGERDDER